MTKTIEQTVFFKASPHEVYEALMDSAKHSKFTGAEANISREAGGDFTAYGGGVRGKNLEVVPDKKIVQTWRASADGWPEDYYTTVTFELEEVKGGTRLTFSQTGCPDDQCDLLTEGWPKYYWEPMKSAFGW